MTGIPKNDHKYRWTQHVVRKMAYYRLSADRVKRIVRHPQRIEEGVAPGTIAVMQKTGPPKKPTEIWTMFAVHGKQKIIVTAWRYPGISPVRGQIQIPQDILNELAGILHGENVI